MAQGITRPSFNVVLRVKLFCGGIQFFKNFTLCDLDNFDVIIGNIILDAYQVYILHSGGRLKVCAKSGYKLMNLNAYYNYTMTNWV